MSPSLKRPGREEFIEPRHNTCFLELTWKIFGQNLVLSLRVIIQDINKISRLHWIVEAFFQSVCFLLTFKLFLTCKLIPEHFLQKIKPYKNETRSVKTQPHRLVRASSQSPSSTWNWTPQRMKLSSRPKQKSSGRKKKGAVEKESDR